MMIPKVSIVIPVFNVERYISECIYSVIGQDYDNIEIVVVNDGSTDGSLEILEGFRSRFSNFKIINQENQGQSVARNSGFEASSGDYVLFVDADDWIDKSTVSLCMRGILGNDVDVVMFSAKAFVDGVDESFEGEYNYTRDSSLVHKRMSSHEFFYRSIEQKNYIVQPCLYLFKKKLMENVRFLPGVVHEDNLFTTELLLNNINANVYCLSDYLFNRRLRPESTMTERKQEKHVEGYFKVAEALSKNSLINKDNNVGRALNIFVAEMLYCALEVALVVNKGKVPFKTRKRVFSILSSLNLKFIRIKRVMTCFFPELLWVKSLVFGK